MKEEQQLEFWSLPPMQGPARRVARPKKKNNRPALPRDYLSDEALDKVRKERGEK